MDVNVFWKLSTFILAGTLYTSAAHPINEEAIIQQKQAYNRYLTTAQKREQTASLSTAEKTEATLQSMTTGAIAFGFMGLVAGVSLPIALVSGAAIGFGGRLYQYYSSNAAGTFAQSLADIKNNIAQDQNRYKNYIVIGEKTYLLSKACHDTTNTGYSIETGILSLKAKLELKSATMNRTINKQYHNNLHHIYTPDMNPSAIYDQYEIYLMPHNKNLVVTFTTVINTLNAHQELKDVIAFIAIRPTPDLNSSSIPLLKQILPRIVIVLKQNIQKEVVQQLINRLNDQLKTIEPSGYWPRYSEKTVEYSALSTLSTAPGVPTNIPNMVFVGYGNTDFKSRYPWLFKRNKLLGFSRNGDMAYPIKNYMIIKIEPVSITHLPEWASQNIPTYVN